LTTEDMDLAPRRVIAVILIAWAPLMVLSALQGGLIGPGHGTPFIKDIGYQLRFLVVAPLLVVAEVVAHRRLRPIVGQFQARGMVPPHEADRFAAIIGSAARLRNSAVAEVIL